MNKKILNSGLLVISVLAVSVLPLIVLAAGGATLKTMAAAVQSAAIDIATPIVIVGWIVAGILYLTAAGSPEKMGTAKKAMVACVIGTVLVVLAIGSNMIIDVIKNAFGIT